MAHDMHLTLRQLKVFEAVARRLSFSRAAEELHLAQPTVSMQVRQLADSAGVPLLEQIGKRIHVTEAGETVRAAAHEVFRALDRLEMLLSEQKGLRRGKLRLAVVTTAKYFVPRLLGPFARQHPGIDIALEVGNRSEIIRRLSAEEDDLYIMGAPPGGIDIARHPFADNPIVAIAPNDHPLAGRRRIPLSRLAGEPFLMREVGSGTRMAAERLLKDKGVRLDVKMELGSNEAIKQAVAGGLGLSMLSLHALALEALRGEFSVLDVAGLPIRRSWYIVHRAGKSLSPVAQTFFEYLRQEGPALRLELDARQRGVSAGARHASAGAGKAPRAAGRTGAGRPASRRGS